MQVDPNEMLMDVGGYRSVEFKQLGASVTGHVVRMDTQQQTEPGNPPKPKFWDDGRPRMQIRVVLQTEERDSQDPDDSGERAIYIKLPSQMQRAIAEVVRKERASGLELGGKLRVTYVSDGAVTSRGMNAPKEYEALYRRPQAQAVSLEQPVAAGSNGQPFDPQPVPRARDMRSSTVVAADGGQQQQPVHDPAPF